MRDIGRCVNYNTVDHAYGTVGEGCQFFVVGDYYKGLSETVSKVEKEPVQFLFIVSIEAA